MRIVRRRGAAVAAALALAAIALPPSAQANWGRAFQIEPPGTLDLLSPAVAFSSGGAATAAFGITDVDTPGSSQALVAQLAPGGYPAPPQVAPPAGVGGAAQVLAMAYDGRSAELLTGVAARGRDCCASAEIVHVGQGGKPWRPRVVVGGLAGATSGQLLTLADGQMLAAVATQRGVWVSQSPRGDRFTHQHLLTGRGEMPESLAAAWLGGERTLVAWTAASGAAGASDPGAVRYAIGSRSAAPAHQLTAVRVARAHRIDELAVAPGGGGSGTAAWIDSWPDSRGGWHAQVRTTDVGSGGGTQTLSPAWRLASGLSLAGDQAGDQAAAWESCTTSGFCNALVAVRRHGGRFTSARSLGPVDPGQPPALAVGPGGEIVVGLVHQGRPWAVTESGPGRAFSRPAALTSSVYAYDLTVAAGTGRRAIAVWSQGTLNPSVVAAAFRG